MSGLRRGDYRIASDEAKRPLKNNLMAGLPQWLQKPGPDDLLILYFSGHGVRDRSGKLYLVPLDGDPTDPASTMIPLEWFRQQLANSKARFKLLILDACHAGSDKPDDTTARIPQEQLDRLFKGLARVMTLASSTESETSQIWPDKRQSLYSYWLNQGLKGH